MSRRSSASLPTQYWCYNTVAQPRPDPDRVAFKHGKNKYFAIPV
jgi:hypothetical protein